MSEPDRSSVAAPAIPWWLPLLVISITAMGPFALNMLVPSMPGMMRQFQTDALHVQLTLTLYLVAMGAAQLCYGPLSDRFGRRPTLIWGLAIYIVAGMFCAVAQSIDMLILGRVFQALGGCAGLVLGRAIVRDLYGRERAASMLAYVTMVMSVAPAVAPVIGGYLDVWIGWRAGFVVLVAFGCGLLAITLLLLPETNRQRLALPGIGGMLRAYAAILRSRVFIGYAACVACSSGVFFTFVAGAPFVVVDLLQLAPSDYGIAFLVASGGYIVGAFAAARCSTRVGSKRMVALGVSLMTLGAGLMAAGALSGWLSLWALTVPMAVVMAGNGMSQPNCIAAAISVNPTLAGTAAGVVGFMQMSFGSAATVAVGQLQDGSQYPMIIVMLVLVTVAWCAWAVATRRR